jgi:glutathione S-transferase
VRIIRQALGRVVTLLEQSPLVPASSRPGQRFDDLVLYHYPACPFCIRVRFALHRYGILIQLRDIDSHPDFRRQLLEQGGRLQVPCLRIENQGQARWLYESGDIIAYLKQRQEQESTL